MAVSNEEVEAARQRVARLREQIADEDAKREQRERDRENEVVLAQIKREEAELEDRLAAARLANEAAESGGFASLAAVVSGDEAPATPTTPEPVVDDKAPASDKGAVAPQNDKK